MNNIVAALLAIGCAGLVAWRVMGVLNHMNLKERTRSYVSWLSFGVSYSVLMVAAFGSAIQVWQGEANVGDWLWLLASTGLIVFDRRHNRHAHSSRMTLSR